MSTKTIIACQWITLSQTFICVINIFDDFYVILKFNIIILYYIILSSSYISYNYISYIIILVTITIILEQFTMVPYYLILVHIISLLIYTPWISHYYGSICKH